MCAIFGVWNLEDAARQTALGLHSNQHRAIDYAGIVSASGGQFYAKHGHGLTRQVFTEEVFASLPGNAALGHIRYPTVTDDAALANIQPIVGEYGGKPVALAHNGNITNVPELRDRLGLARLTTSMDTEFILRLMEAVDPTDIETDLVSVLPLLQGSFALGILLPDRLIAVRDRRGNRPLSIGKINGGYCISSETCALWNLGAEHVSDVDAGSMVILDRNGMRTVRFAEADERRCWFEFIYYSHPGSTVFGKPVDKLRMKLGRLLEECYPVEGGADIVTPIPDSSNFIAMGYASSGRSGAFFPVIARSHYVGRTFIAPTQTRRDTEVAQKFTFSGDSIRGQKIVVIDDSIVRGTTLPKIVRKLRELGAKAVHVRIGSPPIMHSCRYGINTPTRDELIAASATPKEICERVEADSLEFLPLEVLRQASSDPDNHCFACMDGKYW